MAFIFPILRDFKGAIADARVVIKNAPDSVEGLGILAVAQEQDGSANLALDTYQRLLQVKPDNVSALTASSRLLMAQNKEKEAKVRLEEAIKIDPDNAETIRLLADIYSRNQQWDEALSISAKLTEKSETLAMGHYFQGRTYLRKKDYPAAIKSLETSMEADPRIVETLSSLVTAYVLSEQKPKAIAYLNKHIQAHADHGHAKELLANMEAGDNNLAKAESILKNLLNDEPNRISAYRLLSRIYMSQNQLAKVEALYTSGLKKSPENEALKVLLAEAYQAQDKYQDAVDVYEQLLADNPNALVIKNNLASVLLDHFPTEANIKRSLELTAELAESQNAAFLDTAGWAQYMAGNYPQALSLLQAAVAKGGKTATYHYHLGMAYFKSNLSAPAKKELELALNDESVDFIGKEIAKKALQSL